MFASKSAELPPIPSCTTAARAYSGTNARPLLAYDCNRRLEEIGTLNELLRSDAQSGRTSAVWSDRIMDAWESLGEVMKTQRLDLPASLPAHKDSVGAWLDNMSNRVTQILESSLPPMQTLPLFPTHISHSTSPTCYATISALICLALDVLKYCASQESYKKLAQSLNQAAIELCEILKTIPSSRRPQDTSKQMQASQNSMFLPMRKISTATPRLNPALVRASSSMIPTAPTQPASAFGASRSTSSSAASNLGSSGYTSLASSSGSAASSPSSSSTRPASHIPSRPSPLLSTSPSRSPPTVPVAATSESHSVVGSPTITPASIPALLPLLAVESYSKTDITRMPAANVRALHVREFGKEEGTLDNMKKRIKQAIDDNKPAKKKKRKADQLRQSTPLIAPPASESKLDDDAGTAFAFTKLDFSKLDFMADYRLTSTSATPAAEESVEQDDIDQLLEHVAEPFEDEDLSSDEEEVEEADDGPAKKQKVHQSLAASAMDAHVANRPKNTSRGYATAQRTFQRWNELNYNTTEVMDPHQDKLAVYLRTGLRERGKTALVSGKRVRIGEVSPPIVKRAIAAIIDLAHQQHARKPFGTAFIHPRTKLVSMLEKEVKSEFEAARKESHRDRGIGGFQDSFNKDGLKAGSLYWLLKATHCESAARNNFEHLAGHAGLSRGMNRRMLELADCSYVECSELEGPTLCAAFIDESDRSKTNNTGKREYVAYYRHKDPALCAQGAFARYFFLRFDVGGEAPPDMSEPRLWFRTVVLKGQNPMQAISYETDRLAVHEMSNATGNKRSKVTHRYRGDAANAAKFHGADRRDVNLQAGWERKMVSDSSYLTDLPFEVCRTLAGFPKQMGGYYVARDVEVPQELERAIFPWLNQWVDLDKTDPRWQALPFCGIGFIKRLARSRIILLQDIAVLMLEHGSLPAFKPAQLPLCHPLWPDFCERVQQAHIRNGKYNPLGIERIKEVNADLATVLSSYGSSAQQQQAQMSAMHASFTTLLAAQLQAERQQQHLKQQEQQRAMEGYYQQQLQAQNEAYAAALAGRMPAPTASLASDQSGLTANSSLTYPTAPSAFPTAPAFTFASTSPPSPFPFFPLTPPQPLQLAHPYQNSAPSHPLIPSQPTLASAQLVSSTSMSIEAEAAEYKLSRGIKTVAEVWEEWSVGLKRSDDSRSPAVKEMYAKVGAKCYFAMNKGSFFTNRKLIYQEIERLARTFLKDDQSPSQAHYVAAVSSLDALRGSQSLNQLQDLLRQKKQQQKKQSA